MNIENITNAFSNFFTDLKNNNLVMFILIVILALYTSLWVESLQQYTMDTFNNKYFKFVLFVLITYISSSNPALGVILAIAVLVTLQTITYTTMIKSEKFSPSLNDNNNEYLSKPLLKQNDLPNLGNALNLKLQTPDELYINMIKQGRILLDDSLELKQDLLKRYDIREQAIADNAERDGNVLVQSGFNRLQSANNGEYNSLTDNNSLSSKMSNNDKLTSNQKSFYVKYDKFINNYANNQLIIDLFNLLKSKYNELTMNKTLSEQDFDIKLQEIYDTEFDLLISIFDAKKDTLDNILIEKINKKINYVKDLRTNKNHNFYNELNALSTLINP
jgi:hypothetical protein